MTDASAPTSDATPAGKSARRWRVRGALLLILALATFLRFHTLTRRGFFFDELWIVELSNGHGSAFFDLPTDTFFDQLNTVAMSQAKPIWQVPANITGAIHPPAGFVMLRLWRDVFGDSMFALRSFSATWSVLVVLLSFIAVRRCFGASAGLWAALISAIASGNIDQAQDVRAYTMLQAELLLTVIALLAARGKHSSWLCAAGIGVGTLAMMYTHYFAAGACAAIAFGVITLLRGPTRWQALAAIALGGVIWTVTWLPQLRAQLAYVPRTADGFLADRTDYPLLSELERLTASPFQALVADPRALDPITIAGGLGFALLLALRVRTAPVDEKPLVRLWLAIIVFVIGSLLALDVARQTKHLELVKYLVLITPALGALYASGHLWRRWLMPAVVSVALGVLLITTPLPTKTDDRVETDWLKTRMKPDDVVILPSYHARDGDGQVMYLFLAYGVPFDHHRIAIPVGKPPATLLESLPRNVRWFYFAFDPAYDPTTWLPGTQIVERGPVGSAAVYEIRPMDAPSATTPPSTRSDEPLDPNQVPHAMRARATIAK